MDETEEKTSLERLTQRIEDLLVVLDTVARDLRDLVASLKTLGPPPPPAVPVPAEGRRRTTEEVRMMFPEDLESLLTFEEKAEYIMIKPRQYLGSENFAKIASIVRGAGGEYISAGKESHFRIPR